MLYTELALIGVFRVRDVQTRNGRCAYSSHHLFCFVYYDDNRIKTDHVPHDTCINTYNQPYGSEVHRNIMAGHGA